MKSAISKTTVYPIATKYGTFLATFSGKGLCGLSFPNGKFPTKKTAPNPEIRSQLAETKNALEETLSGKKISRFPKLDISDGTDFQQQVWETLRSIPAGKSLTYGEIAKKIRRGKAVRAVGSACGANPVPVLVPCHRVLAANGKLGGFSGGLDWKKRLLKIEGIEFAA